MDFSIESAYDSKTVAEWIRCELKLSGAHLRHLKFHENGILLNGAHVTVRNVLHTGDCLSLALEDEENQALLPVNLPLDIVYEDCDVVVPDKPADMPTHPSCNHHNDTVANALAFRYARQSIPFVFRPVNRLDRNTSGVLLIARNRIAAGKLADAMKKGEIRKEYIAVLDGVPEEPAGIIDTYMRRTAESVIVREICTEADGGSHAVTHYRVIAHTATHAVVLASPITGRTHQLRVHFASIGCPITGDDLYGKSSSLIPRHALHALCLTFPNPSDGTMRNASAPIPSDMQNLIQALFRDKTDLEWLRSLI